MKSDLELKKDILAELLWDPLVPETRVDLAVKRGVVILSGMLNSYPETVATKRAVERVAGVKAIENALAVEPPQADRCSDAQLAAAIEMVLRWNALVPPSRIAFRVVDGWVELTGELDWYHQRRAVERAIRPLRGVVGVTDQIRLRVVPAPSHLAKRIQDALTRQAMRDAERIQIAVEGAVVTLRGQVRSWAERSAAEGATWAAPGVSGVRNELVIERLPDLAPGG
jgi:osmotically-inducible protein OsmY